MACDTPCTSGKKGKCRDKCPTYALIVRETVEQRKLSAGIRPDQETKLISLEEKLLDVFIVEADPDRWPTEERIREALDNAKAQGMIDEKEYRKLRYAASEKAKNIIFWEKKNANQTMALLTRILAYRMKLAELRGEGKTPGSDDEEEMEREIATAEKKVRHRLRLVKGQKQAA